VIHEGPRLSDLYVTASTEGAVVPRVFGRMRVAAEGSGEPAEHAAEGAREGGADGAPGIAEDEGAPSRGPVIHEGPRLSDLYVTASTEGAVVPRVFGRMVFGWLGPPFPPGLRTRSTVWRSRIGVAHTIWPATLCEGPIRGLGTVWADGKPIRLSDHTHRLYLGDEVTTGMRLPKAARARSSNTR
jgi:hypothetical protein